MGYFLKDHDIHVVSLLDQMNLRFAPSQGKKTHFGGIEEMVALQKEFKIFKKNRPFKASVAVLNIGGGNNELKTLMHQYLDNLASHESNKPNQNGDAAIVNALIRNLASKTPLPVYFTFHDMRAEKGNTRGGHGSSGTTGRSRVSCNRGDRPNGLELAVRIGPVHFGYRDASRTVLSVHHRPGVAVSDQRNRASAPASCGALTNTLQRFATVSRGWPGGWM